MKKILLACALLLVKSSVGQVANSWTQKADFGGAGRFGAVGFSIGSKGYLGTGFSYEGTIHYYKDFWEYNPDADTWTQKDDFPGSGLFGAVGFSIGSKGYLGTGYDGIGVKKDFWEYDPNANTWTQKANFSGNARYNAVGFSIGSKGYLGTGFDFNNDIYYKDFWEYDPDSDTWTQKADFVAGRYSAVGFSIESKGYLGTGYSPAAYYKDFWEYDPDLNMWTQKADFGGASRKFAVGFSMDGKGYLGTGQNIVAFKDFWEYDPDADSWTQKADFGGISRYYGVGFTIGSKAYLGTGSVYPGSYKDFWEYTAVCIGLTLYADADEDTYGDISNVYFAADCVIPPGYVEDTTDCDDANAGVHLGATEIFNGIDDDCSGMIDDVPPLKEWDEVYGGDDYDELAALQQTADGGYILGGRTGGYSLSSFDYWIVKTDGNGVIQWDLELGGNDYDFLSALLQTTDGGYIFGGISGSGSTGDKTEPNQGYEDYWFVKTDANGAKQWDKAFGGSGTDRLNSLQQTADGGYILGGYSNSGLSGDKTQPSQGGYDFWVVKTDANGMKQWDARFGGFSDDYLSSLVQTADGGYMLGGSSSSAISGDKTQASQGGSDYWIVKTDANGVKQWDARYGGNSGDGLNSLHQTADGGYMLGGSSSSPISGDKTQESQGESDYWIVKTDVNGVKLWDARYGGSGSDGCSSLQQTADGGFVLGGSSSSAISGDKTQSSQGLNDYWMVKTNANGAKQWDARFGGDDEDAFRSMQQTVDGGYILGGFSDSKKSGDKSQPKEGKDDFWIVKVASDCNGGLTFYADGDGDGYGDVDVSLFVTDCIVPAGYVFDSTDCNDIVTAIHPNAIDLCNGIDDDCDGITDPLSTFYLDADSDGYGDINTSVIDCVAPSNYVADSTDCDDVNGTVHPAATEICNGMDDNCSGVTDEGLLTTYYPDADDDGYGDSFDAGTSLCSDPGAGYSTNNDDCNDANSAINPSIAEICNNIDENCNGSIDDGLIFSTYYADADGDTYGDAGNPVIACAPSNNYVVDNTDCNDANADVHPYAPALQWQKSLGGSDFDYAYSIQQTTAGGFIVAGESYSTDGDISGNLGGMDFWIVKLDSNGNLAWQKSLGGSDYDEARSVRQTTDGGFLVAGFSQSIDGDVSGNHGGYDYWIVKLDADGNIAWQKSLGGSDYDVANSIQQTTDGGFLVAGVSYSIDGDVSGNHGSGDYWIVKLDSGGNLVWQKSLGGSDYDVANSIQQTTDGGFLVAGVSYSIDGDVSGNQGSGDYWIVKLDANGNLAWQKSLGGSSDDIAQSIQQTTDGGFVVAGYSGSNDGDVSGNHGSGDYWIVKLDADGNFAWQKSLGGSDYDVANSIQQTTDGGFVVAGFSYSNDGDVSGNHGLGDYWIVKLDSGGNLVWQKSLGGSSYDYAYSSQQTTDGRFVVAGSSESNDGDISGNHGSNDYWIAKLSSFTGGIETCNGIDDNCNGSIDDGLIFTTYYADTDGDGYGDLFDSGDSLCNNPGAGYSINHTDCEDSNAAINPTATETCNGLDDDCNSTADDGLTFVTYYADVDGDGYGDLFDPGDSLCNNPGAAYSIDHTDCDDANAAINPIAIEICNGLDDNCNLVTDEGLITEIYFADADNDGFGNANNLIDSCAQPLGYLTDSTDCDDTNTNVNPDATEIPNNGIDDNCNGDIDEFGVGVSSTTHNESVFSLFPNPTNGEFVVYLQLDNDLNTEAKIEVINPLGQMVWAKASLLQKGKLQEEIKLTDATNGIYLIRVLVHDQLFSAKIIYHQ